MNAHAKAIRHEEPSRRQRSGAGRKQCRNVHISRRSLRRSRSASSPVPPWPTRSRTAWRSAKANLAKYTVDAGVRGARRAVRRQGLRGRQEADVDPQQQRQPLPQGHHRPHEGGRRRGRARSGRRAEPGHAGRVGAAGRTRDPRQVRHHRPDLGHRSGLDRAVAARPPRPPASR